MADVELMSLLAKEFTEDVLVFLKKNETETDKRRVLEKYVRLLFLKKHLPAALMSIQYQASPAMKKEIYKCLQLLKDEKTG